MPKIMSAPFEKKFRSARMKDRYHTPDALGAQIGGPNAFRESERSVMAHRFTVIFEKEQEGGYHVFCPTLPGCHTQSETIDEGMQNVREAIRLYLESLIEDGLPIPA
jgi:predicted RNase H-like HicB family nuclease